MADALQCLLSIFLDICQNRNISFDEILNKVAEKNKKWKNKISEYKKNL
jgi:cytidylate kinase